MQLSYGATRVCLKEVEASGKPLRKRIARRRSRHGWSLWLMRVKLLSLVGNKA